MVDFSSPPEVSVRESAEPEQEAWGGAIFVLAGCSAGAALIHAAMTPNHVAEWATEGRAFGALAVAQLGIAALALLRPRRWVWIAAVGVNLVTVSGWLWSRTAGFPFGPNSGVAQKIGWIDSIATVLELVVVVIAARLLLRSGEIGVAAEEARPISVAPAWSLAVAGLVVAGTGVLMASPAGQHSHGGDHAHAAGEGAGTDHHGDDHGSGDEAHDDDHGEHGPMPVPERPLDPATREALAAELTTARVVALRLPTVADAEAAGYLRAGPFAPGAGSHYVNQDYGQAQDFDLDKPLAYLYAGTEPTSPVVGIMYFTLTDAPPEGFTGTLDLWHEHSGVCLTTAPDGGLDVPLPPDADVTQEACDRFDGEFLDITGQMVHAWVVPGWDSPMGVFSHDNPLVTCADGRTDLGDDLYLGCDGIAY